MHGEQRFVHHRPVRPGDVLTAKTTIEDIRDAGTNELMRMRMDISTSEGELVCEAYNLVVSRGTAASAAMTPSMTHRATPRSATRPRGRHQQS